MAKSNLPPSGMRDFLPEEKKIRQYVMDVIRNEYSINGFTEIETSEIENLANLVNSDGGDNTKMLFKILKRGEKLKLDKAPGSEDALTDLGLRFDLTLPLSRFYANNRNELPTVFKAIQMGNVFRAERPQRGRYRSFVQCDVDVIGDPTNLTEIELINTVTRTINRLGLKQLVVKVNDRRVLKGYVMAAGFSEDEFSDIAITLDKLDKIGSAGIVEELLSKDYPKEKIDALLTISDRIAKEGLACIAEYSAEGYQNLKTVIDVASAIQNMAEVKFDHTLVRGMGYYTSSIFEIYYGEGGLAIGGGGRYDKMIGKLCGLDAPACGFSIGYERLIDILLDSKFEMPEETKLALFYSEGDDLTEVMKRSIALRQTYSIVSVFLKKKKFGKQVDRIKNEGFDAFTIFGPDMDIKDFDEE